MPPKAKITRDMIVDAAFAIAREQGIASVNARTVSEALGCSTQPVMYHFQRMEELRQAVYRKADAYHSEYIMTCEGEHRLLTTGVRYIRFARQEPHLFRLLFQTGEFAGKSIPELTGAEAAGPMNEAVYQAAGVSPEQARSIFRVLFLFIHGYASLYANNTLVYDEAVIAADLRRVYTGILRATEEESP